MTAIASPRTIEVIEYDGKIFRTQAELETHIDNANALRAESTIYSIALDLAAIADKSPLVRSTLLASLLDPLAEACEQLETIASRSSRSTRIKLRTQA